MAPVTPAPAHVDPALIVDFDITRVHEQSGDFFEGWMTLHAPGTPDLVWTPHHGGHWIVTRGEVIAELFRRSDLLSNAVNCVPPDLAYLTRLIPLQSDPPEHAAYRAAVVKALDAKRIMALEPMIRGIARELIDAARANPAFDFVTDFAEILPIHAFLVLLGVPPEDRPMLRNFAEQMNRPDGSMTAAQLVAAAHDYLRPYVEARMAAPGDDLLSAVLAHGVGGRPWSHDEAMRVASNLLFGGLDTVAAMFGFCIAFLAGSPTHRAAIRADPKIIPRAANELTRRFGSVINARVAAVDFEQSGATVRAGDIVLLPTVLHNLDDRSFPDAATVDFDRGTVKHSTMGHGAHRCLGASLAHVELTILLEEWLAAFPDFALDPAAPPTCAGGQVGTLRSLRLLLTPPAMAA